MTTETGCLKSNIFTLTSDKDISIRQRIPKQLKQIVLEQIFFGWEYLILLPRATCKATVKVLITLAGADLEVSRIN